MLDEQYDPGPAVGTEYGSFNPTPTAETIDVIRKHFTNGYFIGSIIKK
jgi:hypothetical protein